MNDIVYLLILDNQPLHSLDGNQQFKTVIDECLLEAMENRRREAEAMKMTEHYFSDICGYQPPQSQPPQPRVWTREENKVFESIMLIVFRMLYATARTPPEPDERHQRL
ncbi:hypothetical protein HN51_005610 [Arachis hypogaea]